MLAGAVKAFVQVGPTRVPTDITKFSLGVATGKVSANTGVEKAASDVASKNKRVITTPLHAAHLPRGVKLKVSSLAGHARNPCVLVHPAQAALATLLAGLLTLGSNGLLRLPEASSVTYADGLADYSCGSSLGFSTRRTEVPD